MFTYLIPLSQRKRSLTGAVVGLALAVCAAVPIAPAAAADGAEPAAVLPAPVAPETGPALPEAPPFYGNVELKARLDAPGRLMIAGERMHLGLLRRFYTAHGYQLVWDTHGAEMSRLRDAVLRADAHALDPALFHAPALVNRLSALSEVERDLLVSELNGRRTVLLATHDLGYVAEVAQGVAFLSRGRIVGHCQTAGAGPAELRERYAEALAHRSSGEARRPVSVVS